MKSREGLWYDRKRKGDDKTVENLKDTVRDTKESLKNKIKVVGTVISMQIIHCLWLLQL